MEENNLKIKRAIRKSGFYQWQVAKEAGISQYTLCCWLRDELSSEKEQQILEAIKRLTEKEEGGAEQ